MNVGNRRKAYNSYIKKLPVVDSAKEGEKYIYELRHDEEKDFFVIIVWEFYNGKWNIEETTSTNCESKHDLLLLWKSAYKNISTAS